MSRAGYVVFAHGSSVESANEAVRAVAAELARTGGMEMVAAAFLEGGQPSLPHAVDSLVTRGANQVIVVPYFLTLGLHLQRDLPVLVEAARRAHPGLEIVVREPLDGHPRMVEVLLDRALDPRAPDTSRTAQRDAIVSSTDERVRAVRSEKR